MILCGSEWGGSEQAEIAGMDSGFLDMLHDAGDEDVLVLVGQRVDIDLDRVAQVGVDQHRIGARHLHRVAHVALQRVEVVDDLHRAPAQHVGRPDRPPG